MKIYFRTLLIFFCWFSFLQADPLFDPNGCPSHKLLQLLEIVGMEPSQPTLSKINRWAQDNLLRRGERWEPQSDRFEPLKPRIQSLLADLGFLNAVHPCLKQYEGAIVHGALLSTVRLRLNFLIDCWNQGVRFRHLYFLSGARPLEPFEKVAIPGAEWENQMVELVWRQSDVPPEMRQQVAVHFINSPGKIDGRGLKVRPNTNDTVEAWLKTVPPAGHYLAVTNNPYIPRQDLAIKLLSPHSYTFETVGPAAKEDVKMAIVLDEIATAIFLTFQSGNSIEH